MEQQRLKTALKMYQCGRCWYCGFNVEDESAWQLEHQFPKSRGGSNDRTNLVLACAPCNRKKGARTPSEYRDALLSEIDRRLHQATATLSSFTEYDPTAKAAFALIESARSLLIESFSPDFPGERIPQIATGGADLISRRFGEIILEPECVV